MERITSKKLDYLTDKLNYVLGQNRKSHSVIKRGYDKGKITANVGTFYVGKAYDGYQVERITSIGGACSVIVEYRGSARETYLVLKGILEGIELAKEVK